MRSYGITNVAPYATAPAVGAAGDTYYNTTSKSLFLSDGVGWNAISSGGSVSFDGFTRYGASGTVDTSVATATGNNIVAFPVLGESAGSSYTANGANTLFTIPSNGVYDLSAQVTATSTAWPSSPQAPWLGLQLNGNILARTYGNGGFTYESLIISEQRYLYAGDQVGVIMFTSVASQYRVKSPTNVNDPQSPHFSVWRAGSGPAGTPDTPTLWTPLPYTGSWVDYGAPYQIGQYQRLGSQIYVRCTMKNGGLNGSFANLPAGFRPPADLRFSGSDGAMIVVNSIGACLVYASSNGIIGANFNFSNIA